MSARKFNVAVVGLGFGAEFIPLWQKHPHTDCYAICQRNPDKLKECGDHWGIEKRYTSYEELLKDPNMKFECPYCGRPPRLSYVRDRLLASAS